METAGTTVESYDIALLTICLENWKTFAGFAKYWQLGSKGEILHLVLFRADVLVGFLFWFLNDKWFSFILCFLKHPNRVNDFFLWPDTSGGKHYLWQDKINLL